MLPLGQALLQRDHLYRQRRGAAESAGRAQAVQPFGETVGVGAESVQLAVKAGQLLAQQAAQGTHGTYVAGAYQRRIIVQQGDFACVRLRKQQHALQVAQVARLLQYLAEAGGQQLLAIARAYLGAGCYRHAIGRRRQGVASQRIEDLPGAAAGHAAIQQQQVEHFVAGAGQGGRSIDAGVRIGAQAAQAVAEVAAAGRIVIRDQDAQDAGAGTRHLFADIEGGKHDEIHVVQLSLAEWRDMRSISSHLLQCLCLLGLLSSMPARADLALSARQVSMPGVKLQDVTLQVGEDAGGGLRLKLQAARADIAAMGWKRVGLSLDGNLQRDPHLRWLLDGALRLQGAPGGALSNATVSVVIDEGANTLQANIDQAKAVASAWMPLDQPSHAQITLEKLPAGWLQGLLGTMWSGRATGGRLDATLALDVRGKGIQSSGQFTLDDVGFDTPAGTLAGQGVDGAGRIGIDTTGGPARIDLDATLHGGELLLGPLYAKLPSHPVQLGLTATAKGGAFELGRLRVSDADALQLDGTLAFDAKGALSRLRLDRFQARFPAAYQRYGKAWLATMGLHDMRMDGNLSGTLDVREDGLHAFAFDTDGLDFADGDGRLAMSGLHGGMDWSIQGTRPATTLAWRQLLVYRMVNGAAQSRWQSSAGTLSLQRPLDVPVLNGKLRVGDLDWRPAAAKGQRMTTSLTLTGVDMAAFSKAVGWPQFPGTLGGAIPSLRWVDNRFELGGGLSVNVFDGFIDITRLTLQEPFGASPVLTGDIQLRQLDLGALTSVFDFGNITGRLDGSVDKLRLVDWNPVAFDARLLADHGGRISQRAVNNLTSVGGGGMAAGLQGAVLKLFKTFGYKRIGLNCALQDSVCHMGGLEPNGDGYTIVEGSGLPRLQVIGHQRNVDWPTLVRRLKAATEGNGPQIH